MVPNTATIIPIKPSTCQPTRIAALTAIAPGEDCANAVISSISCSSIQCSSSTNFFFIKVTMTKPPPKVKLLMYSVLKTASKAVLTVYRMFYFHPYKFSSPFLIFGQLYSFSYYFKQLLTVTACESPYFPVSLF